MVKWNEPYQKLASCDSTGIIFVWIKYEGRWSIELINDRNTPVTSFAWSHDGRMALICYQVTLMRPEWSLRWDFLLWSGRVRVGGLSGGTEVLVHHVGPGGEPHHGGLDPWWSAGLRGHRTGGHHRNGPARQHRQQGHLHRRHSHQRPPVELWEVQHGGEGGADDVLWQPTLQQDVRLGGLLQQRRHQAHQQLRRCFSCGERNIFENNFLIKIFTVNKNRLPDPADWVVKFRCFVDLSSPLPWPYYEYLPGELLAVAGRISIPGCDESRQTSQHLNRIKFFSEAGQPVATFIIPYYKVGDLK